VDDVVGVDPAAALAAREAAAPFVAPPQGTPHRCGHDPALAPCRDQRGVAGQPPRALGADRRAVLDRVAEVATLCVAQAIMGIPSDRRFLAVARKRLRHLFPELPQQPGFHKRRARLAETIEWLVGVFAAASPGHHDGEAVIGGKGYAGAGFAGAVDEPEAMIVIGALAAVARP
jgi:hypothetical protein